MFPSDINTQFVRKDTSRNGYLHKQYIDILYWSFMCDACNVSQGCALRETEESLVLETC